MRSDLFGSCRPCRSVLSVSTTCSLHVLLLIHSSALCVSVQHQGLRIWQFAPAFKINLNLKYLLSVTSYQKIDKNLKDVEAKRILKWLGTMPRADLSTLTTRRAKVGTASLFPSSQRVWLLMQRQWGRHGVMCLPLWHLAWKAHHSVCFWHSIIRDAESLQSWVHSSKGTSIHPRHTHTYAPTAEHPSKIPRKHPNPISYISAAWLLPVILGQRNNLIHMYDNRATTRLESDLCICMYFMNVRKAMGVRNWNGAQWVYWVQILK